PSSARALWLRTTPACRCHSQSAPTRPPAKPKAAATRGAKPSLRFSSGVWLIARPQKHNLPVARPVLSPLLYASTDRSADMLYFGGFDVPDPFIAFAARGKKI